MGRLSMHADRLKARMQALLSDTVLRCGSCSGSVQRIAVLTCVECVTS